MAHREARSQHRAIKALCKDTEMGEKKGQSKIMNRQNLLGIGKRKMKNMTATLRHPNKGVEGRYGYSYRAEHFSAGVSLLANVWVWKKITPNDFINGTYH